MHLLFIGHLNPDCALDTVYGDHDANRNGYLPRVIVWGRPTNSMPAHPDAGNCMQPGVFRRAYTTFSYPAWGALHGSVSFASFNPDTLADMLICIRGHVGGSAQGQGRDSLLRLLVFGQDRLDTLAVIPLGSLGDFATSPCIAMSIRDNAQLTKPATRDLTGIRSWEFPPITLTFSGPDTTHHTTTTTHLSSVRVYPNPSARAANIEARTLDVGTYDVEVVAANGAVVMRQDVDVNADGDFLRTLDVTPLASGYYVVRLVHAGQLVGNYPIVVAR